MKMIKQSKGQVFNNDNYGLQNIILWANSENALLEIPWRRFSWSMVSRFTLTKSFIYYYHMRWRSLIYDTVFMMPYHVHGSLFIYQAQFSIPFPHMNAVARITFINLLTISIWPVMIWCFSAISYLVGHPYTAWLILDNFYLWICVRVFKSNSDENWNY